MRRFWILRALKFLIFIAAAVAVLGIVVMQLWNWLVPPLTGWHTLVFGQAIALLVLCRVLFGGFRGRSRTWAPAGFRRMSSEERERFRAEMRARCGRGASDDATR